MALSIIIPTLNEADTLGQTLQSLMGHPAEIIVADDGGKDATVKLARQYTTNVIMSPPGRGLQQDIRARQSQGDILVFLHADTQIRIFETGSTLSF